MKVVLDCNVIVSAARSDGACREVVDRVARWHGIVLSDPILHEYRAVARRRGQASHRDTMEFLIGEVERLAFFVDAASVSFGLRDPDDEVYLATAVAGGAILITGNTRDFVESRYGPVEVWTPRSFLDRMK